MWSSSSALLPLLFLLVTLAAAGGLTWLLYRPQGLRAGTVWALAALLPLLAAMSAALSAQARAAHTLRDFNPAPRLLTLTTGDQIHSLSLSAQDAACLERTLRLMAPESRLQLVLPDRPPLPLTPQTRVLGPLPSEAATEALAIRGELHCSVIQSRRDNQR